MNSNTQSPILCPEASGQRMGHPGSLFYSEVNTVSGIIGPRYWKEEKDSERMSHPPDENGRESAHTHFTHGAQDHDKRPEEKKANEFKEKVKADRKRYKEAQARAKKAEKHKKKDTTTP